MKSFTLFELILVVLIIIILISWINSIFSYKQKDYIDAESCLYYIYNEINDFYIRALTSRWIYSGRLIFPIYYNININTNNLILSRESWTYKLINLDKIYFCNKSNYRVYISWSLNISLYKWLNAPRFQNSYIINNSDALTWKVYLIFSWYWIKKELWQILFDKRSQNIFLNICLNWSWWKCILYSNTWQK